MSMSMQIWLAAAILDGRAHMFNFQFSGRRAVLFFRETVESLPQQTCVHTGWALVPRTFDSFTDNRAS